MNFETLEKYTRAYKKIERNFIGEIYEKAVRQTTNWDNFENLTIDDVGIIVDFLGKWNPRVPVSARGVLSVIQESNAYLIQLNNRNWDLDNIEFDITLELATESLTVGDAIKRIYVNFCKEAKYVGATKIMHLLNPKLFMMWDRAIRESYACGDTGGDYLKFMMAMQKFAKDVVEDYKKMYKEDKTLPKLIDEYNWVKYRNKVGLVEYPIDERYTLFYHIKEES